jgi:hypothetical protein
MLGALGLVLVGCGPKEITNADDAEMRKKYGREAYEKAMIDAGRQKELEEQKRQEAIEHPNG